MATECTCLWVWVAEQRNSTGALLSNDSWVLPTVGNRYQLVYPNGSTVCDEVLQGAAAGLCVCVCSRRGVSMSHTEASYEDTYIVVQRPYATMYVSSYVAEASTCQ